MTAYVHKRHFTLLQARQVLSEVRAFCERLTILKKNLDSLNYDIFKHEYFGGLGPNGAKFHPKELEELISILKAFEARGILVKSMDDGLVDFPSLRADGEEVYLCWKLGETDIAFWHSLEGGFSGRRPIDEL